MEKKSKAKRQETKGVSTTGIKPNYSSDTPSSCILPGEKSLTKVKHDLKTVIELMGPTTPHFNESSSITSNMADNEDSYFSTTTVSQAIYSGTPAMFQVVGVGCPSLVEVMEWWTRPSTDEVVGNYKLLCSESFLQLVLPQTLRANQDVSVQCHSSSKEQNQIIDDSETVDMRKKVLVDDVTTEELITDQILPADDKCEEDTDVSKLADKDSTYQELPTNDTPHIREIQCTHNYSFHQENLYAPEKPFPQENPFPQDMSFPQNSQFLPENQFPQEDQYPQVICPPPWMPANVMFNSECMCPQMANYMKHMSAEPDCRGDSPKLIKPKSLFTSLIDTLKEKRMLKGPNKSEYYVMNVKKSTPDQKNPQRLVFDLVGEVPKCQECCCGHKSTQKIEYDRSSEIIDLKDIKNISNQRLIKQDDIMIDSIKRTIEKEKAHRSVRSDNTTRTTKIDVYYFDHGHYEYLHTTDSPPHIATERVAEKTEAYTTRFWAELFGTIHIGISFLVSFILQLFRFLLYSIIRPLIIGLIQLSSDYFFKPFLATIFNGLLQPIMTFFYNLAVSFRDFCKPIAEAIGCFLREIAVLIRAFRIVEVKTEKCTEVQSDKKYKKCRI